MSSERKYFISKDCFCEDVDNSLFILQSKTGQYHELNDSARYILKILDSKGLSIDEIFKEVCNSDYILKKNTVIDFIDQLIEREIVTFTE